MQVTTYAIEISDHQRAIIEVALKEHYIRECRMVGKDIVDEELPILMRMLAKDALATDAINCLNR